MWSKKLDRKTRVKSFPSPNTEDKNARKEYLRQRNLRRKCRLSNPPRKTCDGCTKNDICPVEATQFWLMGDQ